MPKGMPISSDMASARTVSSHAEGEALKDVGQYFPACPQGVAESPCMSLPNHSTYSTGPAYPPENAFQLLHLFWSGFNLSP
jgi:hypothetical protein